jgi:hypothetical protein
MNNNCKKILVAFFILAVISAGYLFYIKYQESKLGYISFNNIEKTQSNGNFYLKNNVAGFSMVVSDSWNINNGEDSISMTSPDIELLESKQSSLATPQEGCWMASAAREINQGDDIEYKEIYSMLNNDDLQSYNTEKNKYEIVYIDSEMALKDILIINNENNQGLSQIVKLPYNNKIYYFETHLFGQDKEKCQEEFNNFLKTISIKKK